MRLHYPVVKVLKDKVWANFFALRLCSISSAFVWACGVLSTLRGISIFVPSVLDSSADITDTFTNRDNNLPRAMMLRRLRRMSLGLGQPAPGAPRSKTKVGSGQ